MDNSIIELRQYTLFGGQRDKLIDQFENHFIDAQEQAGAHIAGAFTDIDDPDRFVWLRQFPDYAARAVALDRFYSGPVWQREREAANATMVDSDNVLVLRPVDLSAVAGWRESPAGIFEAHIYYLADVNEDAFLTWFSGHMQPLLSASGATHLATLISDIRSNNYPRLPIRPDRAFIWLAKWPDVAASRAFEDAWSSQSGWRDDLPGPLLPALMRKPERLRLRPKIFSALK